MDEDADDKRRERHRELCGVIVSIHKIVNVAVNPARATMTSAVLIAVWISTITIRSRGDQLFSHLLSPQE